MIEICAWCRKIVREKGPWSNKDETRGICPGCADMLKKKYRMSSALNSADIETLIKFLAKGNPV